jgi:integrase/recombinase XerD
VTQLRKKMLEEIQRRDYSKSTARVYLHVISDFARYFRRSPDLLGPEQIRQCQVHLFHLKLSPYTIRQHTAALRFFFFKTLNRHFPAAYIPFPKFRKRLPTILSPQEVARLIDAARNLFHRTLIRTLYSTAMRRAELCQLRVSDIDSPRMMIRIQQGKGGRDREVPLSPTLLETLRVYWRWIKPKTYLFPGTVHGWRADAQSQHRLARLSPSGSRCRYYQALFPSQPSPQLCNALAGSWCRSPHHPVFARPLHPRTHSRLPASGTQTFAYRAQPT